MTRINDMMRNGYRHLVHDEDPLTGMKRGWREVRDDDPWKVRSTADMEVRVWAQYLDLHRHGYRPVLASEAYDRGTWRMYGWIDHSGKTREYRDIRRTAKAVASTYDEEGVMTEGDFSSSFTLAVYEADGDRDLVYTGTSCGVTQKDDNFEPCGKGPAVRAYPVPPRVVRLEDVQGLVYGIVRPRLVDGTGNPVELVVRGLERWGENHVEDRSRDTGFEGLAEALSGVGDYEYDDQYLGFALDTPAAAC